MPKEPAVSDENRYWSDVPLQNLAWDAQPTEQDNPQPFELTKPEKKEYRNAVCKLAYALLPNFLNIGVYKNWKGTEFRIRLKGNGQLVSVTSKMLPWHPMGWKRRLPVLKTAFMIVSYYGISLKSSFVLAEYLCSHAEERNPVNDRFIRFNNELTRLSEEHKSDFIPDLFDKVLHPDLIPDYFDKVLLEDWACGDQGSTGLPKTKLIREAVVEIRNTLEHFDDLPPYRPAADPDKSTKSDHLGQFTTHNPYLTSLLQEYSRETSLIEDVVLDIIVRRGITSLRDSGDLSQPLILSANKFLKETDVTPVALKPVIDHLLKHGKH